jgi:hypothetical protein
LVSAPELLALRVTLGADLDERPMAYRRLPEVLAAHARSIEVQHTLRPFAVAMAGENEFDPFKGWRDRPSDQVQGHVSLENAPMPQLGPIWDIRWADTPDVTYFGGTCRINTKAISSIVPIT